MTPSPYRGILTKDSLRELVTLKERTLHGACKIRARNDIEAMERWLDEYFDKPATFRTYKKEAERFLVWCAITRQTELFRLTREDIEAYILFLQNPTPKELWCGPRRQKKMSSSGLPWFPFAKPLSDSAIKTALASLNSFLGYLVDARYLEFNPFTLLRRKSRFKREITDRALTIHERIVTNDEWHAILQTIEEHGGLKEPAQFNQHRLRLLVYSLYFLGLRVDEMARAKWGDVKKINDKWWFFVKGKGERLGKVPVNRTLLETMMQYRHYLRISPLPDPTETGAIIHRFLDSESGLSPRHLSNLIKDLAQKTAQKFTHMPKSYEKLMRFSPHWLRHLSASKQDLAGISFTHIKDNLRHQNEQTTRIYVHSYDDARHADMEKLKI